MEKVDSALVGEPPSERVIVSFWRVARRRSSIELSEDTRSMVEPPWETRSMVEPLLDNRSMVDEEPDDEKLIVPCSPLPEKATLTEMGDGWFQKTRTRTRMRLNRPEVAISSLKLLSDSGMPQVRAPGKGLAST